MKRICSSQKCLIYSVFLVYVLLVLASIFWFYHSSSKGARALLLERARIRISMIRSSLLTAISQKDKTRMFQNIASGRDVKSVLFFEKDGKVLYSDDSRLTGSRLSELPPFWGMVISEAFSSLHFGFFHENTLWYLEPLDEHHLQKKWQSRFFLLGLCPSQIEKNSQKSLLRTLYLTLIFLSLFWYFLIDRLLLLIQDKEETLKTESVTPSLFVAEKPHEEDTDKKIKAEFVPFLFDTGFFLDFEKDFAWQLVEAFEISFQKNMDILKLGLKKKDWQGARSAAHAIKGAAKNLSSFCLGEIAARAQEACEQEDEQELISLVSRMETMGLQLIEDLKTWLEKTHVESQSSGL